MVRNASTYILAYLHSTRYLGLHISGYMYVHTTCRYSSCTCRAVQKRRDGDSSSFVQSPPVVVRAYSIPT